MMGNLTTYVNKNEYKIEIDEKFTNLSTLEEIEDLETTLPGFFDVESIGKQQNKIYIVYDVPEGYESFNKAKNFESVIKMQLIKCLLDNDPLLEAEGKTFLDLNNIFYKNFNTVKLLYRSNGFLPYEKNLSILDQYKVFVLGFYSNKFSYKRYMIDKDTLLKKENSEFMFAVNAADSLADLKAIVDKKLEEEQSKFYGKIQFTVDSKKKSFKRKLFKVFTTLFILMLLFAGTIKQTEKRVALEFKEQLEAAELENELFLALATGDTKKAVSHMEARNEDPLTIAEMLMNAGKYDEAITYDNRIEERVIARLYELDQSELILDLKVESEFIDFEKEIIRFNLDYLSSHAYLIDNKNTLKRLGLAFLDNKEFEMAKSTLERMSTIEEFELNSEEFEELEMYIKRAEIEIEIHDINSQLIALQVSDLNEENDNDVKNQTQILNERLLSLQKELIHLQGIDEQ